MIHYWFFGKCFLIGISAASAVGPIFILTFNNSALKGFSKGLATALGAAVADGFLLFLGLMGMLSFFERSQKYQLAIDLVGGLLLVIFGIYMLMQRKSETLKTSSSSETLFLNAFKAFSLTVFNPLTLFFFVFVSAQLLQVNSDILKTKDLIMGSLLTVGGSLSVFGSVAYFASRLGKAINTKSLRIVSLVTGVIILGIGAYFFIDAIKVVIRIYQ